MADFATEEMDEMMVEDAGDLEVQEEVVGDDGAKHESPDTVSIPSVPKENGDEKATVNTTPSVDHTTIEKETAASSEPVKVEGVEERGNADRPSSRMQEKGGSTQPSSTKGRTRVPRGVAKNEASVKVEESSRTRSSTRSSRKKIDPDFHYDDTVVTGGRRRPASSNKPAGDSSSKSLSGATSSKRLAHASSNRKTSKTDTVDDVKSSVAGAGNDIPKNDRNKDPYAMSDDHPSEDEDMPPALVINVQNSPAKESDRKPQSKNPRTKAPTSNTDASSEHSEGKIASRRKLYCICQKPYGKRFMISCDECEEWFHGDCVGITKAQGKKLGEANTRWVCPMCAIKVNADSPIAAEDLERMIESENLAAEKAAATAAKRKKEGPEEDEHSEEEKEAERGTKTKKGTKKAKVTAKSKARPKEMKPAADEESKYKKIVPPKRKTVAPNSGDKETAKESPKNKSGKPEELPPVESDISMLTLTPLGKPARSGTRILRHSRIVPTPAMPQMFKPDIPVSQSPRADRTERLESTSSTDKVEPVRRSDSTSSASKAVLPAKVEPRTQAKPQPPRTKKEWCIACKVKTTREGNWVYCGSECILRHALDALETLKNADGEPLERIPVADKVAGIELSGNSALARTSLLAWLEAHPSYWVPIPADLLEAREKELMTGPQIDLVRTSIRAMLRDHLLNRLKDAPDLKQKYSVDDLKTLVAKIEDGLYEKFRHFDVDYKLYKAKYRTIVLNINDKKNDNFFRRLITEEIHPADVVNLTQEQMASDALAEWRQKELHKELDMIIQTQTEQQLHPLPPPVKLNHRGDEIDQDLVPNEKTIDLGGASGAPDTSSVDPEIDAESPSEVTKGALSSVSPSQTVSSPNRSFNSLYNVSKPGSSMASPSKPEEDARVTAHKSHTFDINCELCTNSFPSASNKSKSSPKTEYVLPRRPSEKGTAYMSPTVSSSFKVPAEKAAEEEDDASPRSSTSEYSENGGTAGIIWKGQVDTKDLPAAKLVATAVYGRAAEFMAELPKVLDQLGRIQPGQLWPYIEQVKPLKEIAAVILKSPMSRASNEFNSLHYFLTTRGRVSVLGPLPSTFKDFYMIALKENEPLPESLRFPEGVVFPAEHPKLFLGIIVHHPVSRQAVPVVRGMFDIPTKMEQKKPSFVDASPRTPPPIETNPATATYEPSPIRKHDPIVSRYLELAPTASAAAVEPTPVETVDTSEPMELDEEVKSSHIEEVKPLEKEERKEVALKDKSVSELMKIAQSLPSETLKALGLKTSPKKEEKTPADPRLSRMKKEEKVVVEPKVEPVALPSPTKTGTIEIKPIKTVLADVSKLPPVLADVSKPPPSLVDTSKSPSVVDVTRPPPNFVSSFTAETVVPSVPSTSTDAEEADSGGMFSQKFIENLAKIDFPEGLKEALKSIGAGTGSESSSSRNKAPQPLVDVSKPPPPLIHTSTSGIPPAGIPHHSGAPPPLRGTPLPPMAGQQFPPGPMRPAMNVPPLNMARPPFPFPNNNNNQRPMFRQQFPPQMMEHRDPGASFGERPQPGDFRPSGGDQWNQGQRNDGRNDRTSRDRDDFRRLGDRQDRPDRRDDRRRPSPPARDRRDDRREDRLRREDHREDRPVRSKRDDDRPARRRSRSRSPPLRRREERRRRSASRERTTKKQEGGVDEFGRDLSLRQKSSVKRSTSKDSGKDSREKEVEAEKKSEERKERRREASMDKVSDEEGPEDCAKEPKEIEASKKSDE
ncbi:hypothetical protein RvY_15700 [Ramazzottius varieornatus]|uniref:PHD-type domain-containing protein n=1 Tax=Ramazzottius varieornatus TaxID=947166 RepID=A0A1D1VXD3_RAMVA|nr:hypothetical protein RvY_15700 [Ramazzottius varieornatus]